MKKNNLKKIEEPFWENLTPTQFEQFTDVLIRAMSFRQVENRSGIGDGGEDIVAIQPVTHSALEGTIRRWIFQCKRVKKLTRNEILEEISRFSAKEIDTWVLVTTISPTSAFRKWVDELRQEGKANFYVQAWWRNDLNHYIFEHREFLIKNLPPLIINKLQLQKCFRFAKCESNLLDVNDLVAKCRHFTSEQVQRYARNKYIQSLYVSRDIQQYLASFHSTEAFWAKRLKTYCFEKIHGADERIKNSINLLSELKRMLNASRTIPNLVRYDYQKKYFTRIDNLSIWLDKHLLKAVNLLSGLIAEVRVLSDFKFNCQTAQHLRLRDGINAAIDVIKHTIIEASKGSSDFHVEEFKDNRAIERLCAKLIQDGFALQSITVDSLNTLLEHTDLYATIKKRYSQQTPSNYLVQFEDDYKRARSKDNLKKLNRAALAEFYPQETPKSRYNSLDNIMNDMQSIQSKHRNATAVSKTFQKQFELLALCKTLISDLSSSSGLLESAALELKRVHASCIVFIDRAGGGKTSLLCELARQSALRMPTILLFGKENFSAQDDIINKLKQVVLSNDAPSLTDPMRDIDNILQKEGSYLNVFIDGINESRKIPEIDAAIHSFLKWASNHRVRVTLSCRDIYWSFFDFEKWKHFVYELRQNELYQFSESEYNQVMPLYFEHFKIKCELADSALISCKHPLLLRFFCEAYGNPEKDFVNLGLIRDIRLKELFDEYYNRKVDQICYFLRHKNADISSRFLLDLAMYMFKHMTTSFLTYEIERATGHTDSSTQDSVYLRFLDEDIIIEEEPTEQVDARRVFFVYEEFMEYVLAKAFLREYYGMQEKTIEDIFTRLNDAVFKWVNARGVVEYMILMLLGSRNDADVEDGFNLLKYLLTVNNTIWVDAFWSVAGKLPERVLDERLFDLLYHGLSAIDSKKQRLHIKEALIAMSKYHVKSAEILAPVILWSAFLPNILKWSEIKRLKDMTKRDIANLTETLIQKYIQQDRFEYLDIIRTDELLDWVLPYIEENKRYTIHWNLQMKGKPGKTDFIGLMHLIRDLFPEYQIFLLNGLFHSNEKVVSFCADRIRFIPSEQTVVASLCRSFAAVEHRQSIKQILLESANWLEKQRGDECPIKGHLAKRK